MRCCSGRVQDLGGWKEAHSLRVSQMVALNMARKLKIDEAVFKSVPTICGVAPRITID